MNKIVINGGKSLSGTIDIAGAKNSVVGLIPAALLADGICNITNAPQITDNEALFDILKLLGCKGSFDNGNITIDSSNIKNVVIDNEFSSKLRASYYFMGVLLARFHHVEMDFPGGCNIGARPIDLHLKGFEALGANIINEEGSSRYIIDAEKLVGTRIKLDFASVGATINLMLAATLADGTTTLENAAKEAEISNIADFLNNMGANIKGAGTSKIVIEGVSKLYGANISVIPDRIVTGTYLIIGALLGKNLKIKNVNPEHNKALLDKFKDLGIDYKINNDEIVINKCNNLNPVNIKTLVYPGFPTDIGQPMSVLLTQTDGDSYFEETIWENRMGHVPYLQSMGANIEKLDNTHLVIHGKTNLVGKEIVATDLRGGAAMIIAGLIAKGQTKISNIEHILRGYEHIIEKLSAVGADISIISE